MNRLIYWLSEELMFVMIYQCHHCCVLLLVRRQQKNIFVRESTLFSIPKIVVLLLVSTQFVDTKKFARLCKNKEGYGFNGFLIKVLIHANTNRFSSKGNDGDISHFVPKMTSFWSTPAGLKNITHKY